MHGVAWPSVACNNGGFGRDKGAEHDVVARPDLAWLGLCCYGIEKREYIYEMRCR